LVDVVDIKVLTLISKTVLKTTSIIYFLIFLDLIKAKKGQTIFHSKKKIY